MSRLHEFEHESAAALEAYIEALRTVTAMHLRAKRLGTPEARKAAALAEHATRMAHERWERVVRGEGPICL